MDKLQGILVAAYFLTCTLSWSDSASSVLAENGSRLFQDKKIKNVAQPATLGVGRPFVPDKRSPYKVYDAVAQATDPFTSAQPVQAVNLDGTEGNVAKSAKGPDLTNSALDKELYSDTYYGISPPTKIQPNKPLDLARMYDGGQVSVTEANWTPQHDLTTSTDVAATDGGLTTSGNNVHEFTRVEEQPFQHTATITNGITDSTSSAIDASSQGGVDGSDTNTAVVLTESSAVNTDILPAKTAEAHGKPPAIHVHTGEIVHDVVSVDHLDGPAELPVVPLQENPSGNSMATSNNPKAIHIQLSPSESAVIDSQLDGGNSDVVGIEKQQEANSKPIVDTPPSIDQPKNTKSQSSHHQITIDTDTGEIVHEGTVTIVATENHPALQELNVKDIAKNSPGSPFILRQDMLDESVMHSFHAKDQPLSTSYDIASEHGGNQSEQEHQLSSSSNPYSAFEVDEKEISVDSHRNEMKTMPVELAKGSYHAQEDAVGVHEAGSPSRHDERFDTELSNDEQRSSEGDYHYAGATGNLYDESHSNGPRDSHADEFDGDSRSQANNSPTSRNDERNDMDNSFEEDANDDGESDRETSLHAHKEREQLQIKVTSKRKKHPKEEHHPEEEDQQEEESMRQGKERDARPLNEEHREHMRPEPAGDRNDDDRDPHREDGNRFPLRADFSQKPHHRNEDREDKLSAVDRGHRKPHASEEYDHALHSTDEVKFRKWRSRDQGRGSMHSRDKNEHESDNKSEHESRYEHENEQDRETTRDHESESESRQAHERESEGESEHKSSNEHKSKYEHDNEQEREPTGEQESESESRHAHERESERESEQKSSNEREKDQQREPTVRHDSESESRHAYEHESEIESRHVYQHESEGENEYENEHRSEHRSEHDSNEVRDNKGSHEHRPSQHGRHHAYPEDGDEERDEAGAGSQHHSTAESNNMADVAELDEGLHPEPEAPSDGSDIEYRSRGPLPEAGSTSRAVSPIQNPSNYRKAVLKQLKHQTELIDPPYLQHDDPHGDGMGVGVIDGPDIIVNRPADKPEHESTSVSKPLATEGRTFESIETRETPSNTNHTSRQANDLIGTKSRPNLDKEYTTHNDVEDNEAETVRKPFRPKPTSKTETLVTATHPPPISTFSITRRHSPTPSHVTDHTTQRMSSTRLVTHSLARKEKSKKLTLRNRALDFIAEPKRTQRKNLRDSHDGITQDTTARVLVSQVGRVVTGDKATSPVPLPTQKAIALRPLRLQNDELSPDSRGSGKNGDASVHLQPTFMLAALPRLADLPKSLLISTLTSLIKQRDATSANISVDAGKSKAVQDERTRQAILEEAAGETRTLKSKHFRERGQRRKLPRLTVAPPKTKKIYERSRKVTASSIKGLPTVNMGYRRTSPSMIPTRASGKARANTGKTRLSFSKHDDQLREVERAHRTALVRATNAERLPLLNRQPTENKLEMRLVRATTDYRKLETSEQHKHKNSYVPRKAGHATNFLGDTSPQKPVQFDTDSDDQYIQHQAATQLGEVRQSISQPLLRPTKPLTVENWMANPTYKVHDDGDEIDRSMLNTPKSRNPAGTATNYDQEQSDDSAGILTLTKPSAAHSPLRILQPSLKAKRPLAGLTNASIIEGIQAKARYPNPKVIPYKMQPRHRPLQLGAKQQRNNRTYSPEISQTRDSFLVTRKSLMPHKHHRLRHQTHRVHLSSNLRDDEYNIREEFLRELVRNVDKARVRKRVLSLRSVNLSNLEKKKRALKTTTPLRITP